MARIAPEMIHVAPLPQAVPGDATDSADGFQTTGNPQDGFEFVDLDSEPDRFDQGEPASRTADSLLEPSGWWLSSESSAVLVEAAGSLAASAPVVVECRPEQVAALAGQGLLVAVAPDDLGAEPGGALEAVVTAALCDGARMVRSTHGLEVRRCMHLTAALLLERDGLPS